MFIGEAGEARGQKGVVSHGIAFCYTKLIES